MPITATSSSQSGGNHHLWLIESCAKWYATSLTLKSDRIRALNRQQSGLGTVAVLRAVEAQIEFLNQQIINLEQQIVDHIDQDPDLKRDKELLLSIPGIGDTTAAVFLAEVPDVSRFSQARQ